MDNVEIIVQRIEESPNLTFEVTVNEEISSTRHLLMMGDNFYKGLNTEVSPEKIIEESFFFLLSKEPKEMIYSKFDVSIITNYYYDYLDYLKEKI